MALRISSQKELNNKHHISVRWVIIAIIAMSLFTVFVAINSRDVEAVIRNFGLLLFWCAMLFIEKNFAAQQAIVHLDDSALYIETKEIKEEVSPRKIIDVKYALIIPISFSPIVIRFEDREQNTSTVRFYPIQINNRNRQFFKKDDGTFSKSVKNHINYLSRKSRVHKA